MHRKFDAIEVDRLRVKPIVKITGEFYLQTVEGDPQLQHPPLARSRRRPGLPGRRSPCGWTTACAGTSSASRTTSGIERGARAEDRAPAAPLQRVYRWTLQPAAARARRSARTSCPTSSSCGSSPRRSSTAACRRRRRHAGRQGAVGASPQEGAHDLRAVAVFVHAEHDEHRRHGRGDRQVSGPALRAARDQGRRRGPRALALPDDPHRGQEARAARVRRGARAHRPDRCEVRALPRRASGDEARDLPRSAQRRRPPARPPNMVAARRASAGWRAANEARRHRRRLHDRQGGGVGGRPASSGRTTSATTRGRRRRSSSSSAAWRPRPA